MKNKLLVLALIGVVLGCGMVFIGCSGCPGGTVTVGKGNCTSKASSGVYDQCVNKCITAQGSYAGYGTYYYFDSLKSCTCN